MNQACQQSGTEPGQQSTETGFSGSHDPGSAEHEKPGPWSHEPGSGTDAQNPGSVEPSGAMDQWDQWDQWLHGSAEPMDQWDQWDQWLRGSADEERSGGES
ncbi:unnamed protein product [Boreogadus saida]